MSLKQKLRQLVQRTNEPKRVLTQRLTPLQLKARNIEAEKFILETRQIKPREFLRMQRTPLMFHRAAFNALGTTLERCRNPISVSNDVRRWLAKDKLTPAIWILILAGKETGQVGRNDILRHLAERGRFELGHMVLQYTKKWGFPEDVYSTVALAEGATNSYKNVRQKFAEAKMTPKSRQIFANVLLKPFLQTCEAREGFEFFMEVPKNVQTYQIMMATMVKRPHMRRYKARVLQQLKEDVKANKIETDIKLEETIEALDYYTNIAAQGPGNDKTYKKALEKEREELFAAKKEVNAAALAAEKEKLAAKREIIAQHGFLPRDGTGRRHGYKIENPQFADVIDHNRLKEESFRARIAYGQDAVPMASYLPARTPNLKFSSKRNN